MIEAPPRESTDPLHRTGPEGFALDCEDWDEWDKPAPPFSIAPHLYYVGTCGISVLLFETPDGSVLIDTGPEEAFDAIVQNMRTMGLDPSKVRLILTSHEHFDHVGALARFQREFGGTLVAALPAAASVIGSGEAGSDDPQAGMHDPMQPVKNVVTLASGEPVTFGGTTFHPIATPGHTPGATSWQFEICFGPTCHTIVYADSLSPVSREDYRFSDHPEYLGAYRAGIERLRALKCDILLTPHPSHSNMIERAATGTFDGGMSCAQYADSKTKALDDRLAKEAASR